jgi:hypothetical protein
MSDKMEEDVEPKDEDGVNGRGVSGCDGWVCGLGAVGVLRIFGLVRRAGASVCSYCVTYHMECGYSNRLYCK